MGNNNFLILDTSYIIFYRYHALKSWFKKAYPDQSEDLEIFKQKYPKLFNKCINDLIKKNHINYNNVFFCKDESKENLWRFKIYPNYKKGRTCDSNISHFFFEAYNNLIPEFEKKGCHLLKVSECEADDIAAILTKRILSKDPESIITIITNDYDYLQLINPRVNIINLTGKNLENKIKYSPDIDLKIKIILGDKSDNITSIIKNIGIKKAYQISTNEEIFNKYISNNIEINQLYNLNKELIDFNYIPEKIILRIDNFINKIL